MLLEKYEDFLELPVKQFVIQSIPICLVHIMCGLLMLLVAQLARYLLYQSRFMQVQV